ncbi:MAG: hypothetical protein ACK4PI_13105 [Tepidisphaerales bacterium]
MADVWLIRGADRDTGADRTLEVEAESEAQALRAARAAGLLVETVERRAAPRPPEPTAPPAVDGAGTFNETDGVKETDDVAIVPPYESLRRPPSPAEHPPLPAGITLADVASPRPPNYGALLVLSKVLIIYAWIGYVACAVLFLIAVVGAVAVGSSWPFNTPGMAPPPAGPRWVATGLAILAAALWFAVPLLAFLVIHAVGHALAALRDIARSVYRRT